MSLDKELDYKARITALRPILRDYIYAAEHSSGLHHIRGEAAIFDGTKPVDAIKEGDRSHQREVYSTPFGERFVMIAFASDSEWRVVITVSSTFGSSLPFTDEGTSNPIAVRDYVFDHIGRISNSPDNA